MLEVLNKILPFMIKVFALFLGGILSLVLSGDIDLDSKKRAKLTINIPIILKLGLSISLGLFIGKFAIDYFDFEHFNYYTHAIFYLISSTFGMLIFGIVYRSIQITFTDKTVKEIIKEMKEITFAIIK